MEASALTVTVVLVLVLVSIGLWVAALVSFLRFFREYRRWREADQGTGHLPWFKAYLLTPADYRRLVRAEERDDGLSVARRYLVRFVLGVVGFIALVWLTVGLTTVFD